MKIVHRQFKYAFEEMNINIRADHAEPPNFPAEAQVTSSTPTETTPKRTPLQHAKYVPRRYDFLT